jgi:hypothetical protein
VQELTVLNEATTALLSPPQHRARAIERLTIHGTYLYRSKIIFDYTRNLRQLSLKLMNEFASRNEHNGDPNGPRVWKEAWEMLRRFKDTLEYLDLYQPPFNMKPGAPALFDNSCAGRYGRELMPFCPPLAEFKNLRQLNLPPLGLHGYQCDHPDGQKFRNHLPPNLESIGIYTDPGKWVQQYFYYLDTELEGIALEGSRAGGRLRAVVCDSTHAGRIDTHGLQAACAANGIFYSGEGDKYLFYCGRESLWRDIIDSELCSDPKERFEKRDPGRVIPRGMVVNDIPGRLREEVPFYL